MTKYLSVMKQGAIAAIVAGFIGGIYGLFSEITPLHGANRFIYILGILLILYSILGNITFSDKKDGAADNQLQGTPPLKKEELHEKMMKRKKSLKDAPKDYVRAGVVMLIAVLLEYIRFNIL